MADGDESSAGVVLRGALDELAPPAAETTSSVPTVSRADQRNLGDPRSLPGSTKRSRSVAITGGGVPTLGVLILAAVRVLLVIGVD